MSSHEGRQLHAFFFPFLGHGHMIPMTDIAVLFSFHGVKSTIITTPLNASNISSKINCSQNSGLDINIKIVSFPAEQVGLPRGCENIDSITSTDMNDNFLEATAMLQPQLEQLVQEIHPDCIISDMFFPWTNDVAFKHGIPRLIFHGSSFFSMCVFDSLQRCSPLIYAGETFVVPGLPDQIEMKSSQMLSGFTLSSIFLALMDRIRQAEATSYGVVVNSFYKLESAYVEHYRQVIGRRAWHIGPVSLSNTNSIEKAQRGMIPAVDEHYCLNWLDSKDQSSVIYVSFGSLARFSCAQLIEIAQGLEASGVSFIWVVRILDIEEKEKFLPDAFERRMENKGLVIRGWAPQVLILDHPAIGGFITHCGWNSILEGVSAGVPMITWPLFAEQFQNEVLISEVLKVGIRVGAEKWDMWVEPGNVSVRKERIEKVVTQLMTSEKGAEMRKKARELKLMAIVAVEEGGSSHSDLTALIQELHK